MNRQLCSALNNQRGYMAIFIALIFQLLFIFFAMVINIGLLVHDKINLQNSVDLAAFYAAGKQAEVLNAMSHTNYQIRQSWKLLSWRVRALGDMAAKGHPFLAPPPSEDNVNPQNPTGAQDIGMPSDFPIICTKHSWWREGGREENYCKNIIGDSQVKFPPVPALPPITAMGAVGAINAALTGFLNKLRDNFISGCKGTGQQSFAVATKWMAAYRSDIANRTQVMELYKNNLSRNPADFEDIEGDSVSSGTLKTLEKNLTRANRQNLNYKMYNSLGQQTAWLNKILVRPVVYYMNPRNDNGTCVPEATDCSVPPHYGPQDAKTKALAKICAGPLEAQDPMYSTVGYEKNPWIMPYVGIEVTVQGRRPFAPFGGAVTLRARAFAKPFGGRMGPWFRSEWQRSAPGSSGGGFVDANLPVALNTPQTPQDKNTAVPNYSRWPGDPIGLRSQLTMANLRKRFLESPKERLSLSLWGAVDLNSGTGMDDPLAWETTDTDPPVPKPASGYNGPWIRSFEIAAVIPDLFDVTYYSIDPQFYQTYVMRASANAFNNSVKPRPDLGYHLGSAEFEKMNVYKQITQFANRYDPTTSYIIKDVNPRVAVAKLLTGWAPNQVDSQFNYEFPDSVFAKCESEYRPEGRGFAGGCGYGGRVGYSVKLVSEAYLKDPEAAQAGGGNVGPILNPPPDDL